MDKSTVQTVAGGDPSDFLTVRHIRAGGTQSEIGRQLAAAAHAVHGPAAVPRAAVHTLVERTRRHWFELSYPIQAARMRGVADYFDMDPDDPSSVLDWLGTYDLPAGCSVAFYPGTRTKSGHGVLSRNFDFPTASLSQIVGLPTVEGERPLAADPWIVELHPDEGYASVTVGIMDVMGAMDGINEAGLAVALLADNETPDAEPTGAPAVGLAEHQVVRYLLDTCATVDEAKHALLLAKHYYFFTPCHFVVSDRSGRSFVWEHSPRRNQESIIDGAASSPLVCTNHLLHRWPETSLLPADERPIGTAALTYRRWRTLTTMNTNGPLVDDDDIRVQFAAVRFEAPIQEARTFWHALYDVEDATATVSFFLHDDDGKSIYSQPVTVDVHGKN
jgi:hypothetical protein